MYRLALLTASVSFLLIIAGGLVTSTDSGLAVPDWPLSFGTWMPPMVGGIRFEHTHRMIAATVGLLTLLLTLCLLFKESRRQVRWLGIFAFGLVVFQGILGGITVLRGLPTLVSIGHALMAQTFFATIVVLATLLSPGWKSSHTQVAVKESHHDTLLPILTTLAIYIQLIFGATLRHLGWLPHLLIAHILGAIVVFVLVVRTSGTFLKRYRQNLTFTRPARSMIWLLLGQWVLGFTTLIRGADVGVATAHVAVGALLLAVSTRLTILSWKST